MARALDGFEIRIANGADRLAVRADREVRAVLSQSLGRAAGRDLGLAVMTTRRVSNAIVPEVADQILELEHRPGVQLGADLNQTRRAQARIADIQPFKILA